MRRFRFIILCILLLAAAPTPYAFTLAPSSAEGHNVPFLCQAPFANWSQPWQDACEEAAIVMGMRFADGKPLSKETGSWEIMQLVKYQKKTLGGHHDLTAQQTARL